MEVQRRTALLHPTHHNGKKLKIKNKIEGRKKSSQRKVEIDIAKLKWAKTYTTQGLYDRADPSLTLK